MIIENVNGEARQVFDFSTPDVQAKFYAPVRVGAGYRARIELAKAGAASVDPRLLGVATTLLRGRKKPNGMSDDHWQEQLRSELQEAILSSIQAEDLNRTPDERLAVLETLLTPAPESMPVKVWYMEFAEDSEVESVVNFSKGVAENKIETAQSLPKSGKATGASRKAAQSKVTSPHPSEV